MSRGWKYKLGRLFQPGWLWAVLLTLCFAPALCYVLWAGNEKSPAAYAVYTANTYLLAVWATYLLRAAKRIRAAALGNRLGRRYLRDLSFRGKLSLFAATGINGCYAILKLGAGFYYRSYWLGAIAVYYLFLTAARGMLAWNIHRGCLDPRQEYRAVRRCGWLLLLLNGALAAVIVQMVLDGKGYRYPGSLIFVAALYAFYSVATAAVNLVRFRRLNRPVLSASKALGFATALVSMLSLQTAMFSSFGGELDFQRRMNAATGAAVCLLLLAMAVGILLRTNRQLRRLAAGQSMNERKDHYAKQ